MKRKLASALVAGVFCSFALVGCGDESSTTAKETIKGPGGTTERTVTDKVKSTGDNPPPASNGETGKTPK